MYPSGIWRGMWEQEGYGKQSMEAFELHFARGRIQGHGIDIVGRFTFHGEYDPTNGRVEMTKKYHGKHEVRYVGDPDGEGSILGTWTVSTTFGGLTWTGRGPFRLHPELPKPTGEEPIFEIVR